MLSEDTSPMPVLSSAGSKPRQWLGGLARGVAGGLGRFLKRLLLGGYPQAPELPDDLRADVGFEAPLYEREDAFWEARRNSVGQYLPF